MKIQQTKRLETAAVLVLLVGANAAAELKKHSFFKPFKAEDAKYLLAFVAATPLKLASAHFVFLPSGQRALILGKGKPGEFSRRRATLTMRQAVSVAKREGFEAIQVCVEDFQANAAGSAKDSASELAERLATQFELANFEFNIYKAAPEGGWKAVKAAYVFSAKKSNAQKALDRGVIIGEEINAARTLSNMPPNDMNPEILGNAALEIAKRVGLKAKILDEKEIAALGMGGLVGVGQGSNSAPRFIVLEYMKGGKGQKPVVLAGKGITFDSGGLNLKPSSGIYEMHMDMSGGAAVMHTVAALARLKAKKNVVALIPAAENMVSGKSYRPGDVLKTMSGKTIEVMDTDAEGRIVLSDALEYAKKYKPRLVVDVATLTGAAMVALGTRASALFATSRSVEDRLRTIGEATADFVWPLPLWAEYEEDLRSSFADVANISKVRYGGAITAAAFLWQFIKDYPWVHLDIAPRMTANEGEFLAKGAAGASVNLLVHFLEKF